MADSIFLLDEDSTLRELTEAHHLTEANLQQLLADFPQLMAGKQLDEASPRRWLLVKRELGIPDGQECANRWSIDHLFLDQDGISRLVEVKRSTGHPHPARGRRTASRLRFQRDGVLDAGKQHRSYKATCG
ncbi:hypothetical protein [Lewinella sp. IMCC34191]|uniref:hypothetical protein n=1 Tax=Lewinella sp. IMCC34191 TaxID=2259172 RepID=UPI000E285CBC|nr:hypothetical protein [Lewinella sp. IMCC34191]